MEETIFDYLRKERVEAKNDFKERTENQEKIIKRHNELSGETAKADTKEKLNKIILIIDSWISNFNDLENSNLFYLGDVPETYFTNTWKDFAKEWKPKFEQLRERAKFKADNIKQQNPEPQQQFTKTLSEKQQEYLYNKLTEGDVFLSKNDTDYSSFCYVFGGSIKPESFKPLKWLQNVQLLRELLEPLLITYKTQEFVIPPYFKKKKGEVINHLSGNNPKPNNLCGKITSIHKGLNQTL